MTRDLTDRQFLAALKRHGFGRPVLGGWVEHPDCPNRSFGLRLRQSRSGWTLDKRGSLKKLLADLAAERANTERENLAA